MILVVGDDQGERDRQVLQGVGGQEQREATQVQFVDAQCAAEMLQHFAPVLGHVELLGMVVEHVIGESRGQLEKVFT